MKSSKNVKLLFLDLNGVLDSEKSTKLNELDPVCIENLNYITDTTNAEIVLTSDWRTTNGVDEMLHKFGVTGKIIGKTPLNNYSCRGYEIVLYLMDYAENNNMDVDDIKYIIVDDRDDFMFVFQLDNMVKTDYKIGLRKEDADKIIAILNEK
jgi:hypothetical protein